MDLGLYGADATRRRSARRNGFNAAAARADNSAWGAVHHLGHEHDKPRTIVTTDPELDDLNSMIRMLLYSNEIPIEGLVYSSSQHHYAGDPAAGIPEFRWKAGQSHVEDALDAYDRVDENLRRHDREFPTAAALRLKYRVGNIRNVGDMSESTPGSRLIANVLLDPKPGPVFLEAWGGTNTIARAAGYREPLQGHARMARHLRASVREGDHHALRYFTRNSILPEDRHLVEPEWTRETVSRVGPLGALYRVWGDGRFMAQNFDREDFFGFDTTLPENSREALIARGYLVWSPLYPPGAFISEGDSSNFALLIDNGLRSYEDATFGGWAGRQLPDPANPYLYSPPAASAGDVDPETGTRPSDFHAARWWNDIQMDFAARLNWSLTSHRRDANPEPRARVLGSRLNIAVKPRQRVRLVGLGGDPDGDDVTSKWWQYPEAGTYGGRVTLATKDHGRVSAAEFVVPQDAQRGQTIHLILEVRDDGTPAMTSYQRVVATVR